MERVQYQIFPVGGALHGGPWAYRTEAQAYASLCSRLKNTSRPQRIMLAKAYPNGTYEDIGTYELQGDEVVKIK